MINTQAAGRLVLLYFSLLRPVPTIWTRTVYYCVYVPGNYIERLHTNSYLRGFNTTLGHRPHRLTATVVRLATAYICQCMP